MVGKTVQATMLVPRSNGRGLVFSEVCVVRAFDFPIAGRSFRFAIHPRRAVGAHHLRHFRVQDRSSVRSVAHESEAPLSSCR